ncbi:MAG: glycosyltransferase family 2 protein, partial [Candidatus Hodarchaeota archaeon]
ILQLTIIPILRNYTSTVDPKPDENDQVVDYVKGALMIVPKKLLEQLNLRFDENYFMYHEDMDFAFQLQKHGKHCLLDPTPAGIHYGMHFEDVGDEKVFLWRNKSLLYFIWKNHGRFKAIIFALINIIIFSIKYILSFNNRNHRRTYKKVIQFILECLSGKMASCSTLKNS